MTIEDIVWIRGSSLTHYEGLVSELGGDPDLLLGRAGVPLGDVGDRDALVGYEAMLVALDLAAAATSTPDFGRRLSQRQDIEVLGILGAAVRTAPTLRAALEVMERYLVSFSPALTMRVIDNDRSGRSRLEVGTRFASSHRLDQCVELSLGLVLAVIRSLTDERWAPLSAHFPHRCLASQRDYQQHFGCPVRFSERFIGFTLCSADLDRPVDGDEVIHRALVDHLETITAQTVGFTWPVRELVRDLLPTGAASMTTVARHLNLHPKTLQRRLRCESTTFADVVDSVRRETALNYLRDTELTMTHLARELGYSEQSVLTRSCRRWFGRTPLQLRQHSRAEGAGRFKAGSEGWSAPALP